MTVTNLSLFYRCGGKPKQPRYHRYDSTCYLKIVLAIYNQSNGILLQEEGGSEVKFLEKLKTLSGGQIPPKKRKKNGGICNAPARPTHRHKKAISTPNDSLPPYFFGR